ncbi:hypothetical protein YY92_08275 [Campylobacter fetus]|uniref:hypothetical protein n=1 Tax=Campylobacter fetus TaxID=196 RepID=UPI0011C7F72C|nr:hypothetical protein [Campylobacter fetus]EAJ1232616.1 hypothetical protein [Campylobacter fetus]EAK0414705.1 hypothetical protein [Campylobacter fetus]TXF09179.1 hypothetical protein FPD25_03330 [Campylobacter fetus subsp. fetus]
MNLEILLYGSGFLGIMIFNYFFIAPEDEKIADKIAIAFAFAVIAPVAIIGFGLYYVAKKIEKQINKGKKMENQKKVTESNVIRAVLAEEHGDIVTRKKGSDGEWVSFLYSEYFSIYSAYFSTNGASLSSINFKISGEDYDEQEDNIIRAMMALKYGKLFTRKKGVDVEWIPYLDGFYFNKEGLGCYFGEEWVKFDNLYFKISGEDYDEAKDTLIRALIIVQYHQILTRKKGTDEEWIPYCGSLYFDEEMKRVKNLEFKVYDKKRIKMGNQKKVTEMAESDLIRILCAIKYNAIRTRKKSQGGELVKPTDEMFLKNKFNWNDHEFMVPECNDTRVYW